MIRCTIVEITSQTDEAASRSARATVSEILTLGRGAACKIYLPDPRVRLEHASMERAEDGYLYMAGCGGTVQVDGEPQERVRVAVGQRLVIGPFEFLVDKLDHGPDVAQVLLTLNFSHKPATPAQSESAPTHSGLRRSLLNLRSLSWLAAFLATVFLLTLPLWQAYQPKPLLHSTQESQLDVAWNPGPLSSAHQSMGKQCKHCHVTPFERVQDSACASCHKNSGPHIRGNASLQQQAFSEQRCASCHREHQGEDGMKKIDALSCEGCHQNVKAHAPLTTLPNVGDFGQDHPAFRLSMRVSTPNSPPVRRLHNAGLKENSGLKFPHDQHLSPQGIKSPNGPIASGGRVVMECNNCHRLDSAKVRYQPIQMERDCAGCHRLGVDAQSPSRLLPHAQPQAVLKALQDQFSALALERHPSQVVTVNTLLQGPQIQPTAPVSLSAARWVSEKTQTAAKDLFENPNGSCQTCHTISRVADTAPTAPTGSASWTVTPVLSNDHWLPVSLFSHAQHSNAKCTSCHGASTSKSSSDILIPTITTCRNCHTGTRAHIQSLNLSRQDKVVSQCSTCHGFHAPTVHASFAVDSPSLDTAPTARLKP